MHKLIIWISNLIGWIPYHFSKEIQSFWDYDTYFVGSLKGLAIAYSIYHPDQAVETIVWTKNYVIFSTYIDCNGTIYYITLFNKDVYY